VSDWRNVVGRTPECIDATRYSEELTTSERVHLSNCIHCEAELKLFREVTAEETSEESRWVAAKLLKPVRVVAFRRKASKATRVLYAAAAALVLLVGAGTWLRSRGPAIEVPVGAQVYRSARLELLTPVGDVQRPPNELRWKGVPAAARYRARIVEVDGVEVWSVETSEPQVGLPPDVTALFKPGKTLLWDVRAIRGDRVVATSETANVRVIP
jgi:hypothetical protein